MERKRAVRAQTCTFEGPVLQKLHQNSTRRPPERKKRHKKTPREREKERHEKTPPREKKRAKMGAGEEKQARNFGRSDGVGSIQGSRGGGSGGGWSRGGVPAFRIFVSKVGSTLKFGNLIVFSAGNILLFSNDLVVDDPVGLI